MKLFRLALATSALASVAAARRREPDADPDEESALTVESIEKELVDEEQALSDADEDGVDPPASEAKPDEGAKEGAKPAEAKPAAAETKPSENMAEELPIPPAPGKKEEANTEEAKTKEAKTKEAKTEKAKTKEAKTKEAKAEETKAEDTKAEDTKAEDPKAEDPKAENPKAENPKAENPKAENPKAEEAKAAEVKAEEAKAAEVKPAQNKESEPAKPDARTADGSKADEANTDVPEKTVGKAQVADADSATAGKAVEAAAAKSKGESKAEATAEPESDQADDEEEESDEEESADPTTTTTTTTTKSFEEIEAEKKEKLLAETDEMVKAISEQTKSSDLAKMMKTLRSDIFDANSDVRFLMKTTTKDGVKVKEEKKKPNQHWVHPMSTTVWSVMNLSCQYFIILTALTVVRTFNSLVGAASSTTENILSVALDNVAYAPMLCILFIGTRLRSLEIAGPDGAPQEWVQGSMVICAWAVLIQTVLVLVVPSISGREIISEDGMIVGYKGQPGGSGGLFEILRYMTMATLYASFSLVILGAFSMDAESLGLEEEQWTKFDLPETATVETAPALSPALFGTIFLAAQFFAVYLLLAIARALVAARPASSALKSAEGLMVMAKHTVSLAPMLAVLFVCARYRAEMLTPAGAETPMAPPRWAQTMFQVTCYGLLASTLLVLVMPLVGYQARPGKFAGHVEVEGRGGAMTFLVVALKQISLLSVKAGAVAVLVAVLSMHSEGAAGEAAKGAEATSFAQLSAVVAHHHRHGSLVADHGTESHAARALLRASHSVAASTTRWLPTADELPTSLECVMVLAATYLFVYLLLFGLQSVEQVTLKSYHRAEQVLASCEVSVKFAPVLSVLFLAARLRAARLGDEGVPQCFAQDGMRLSVLAVIAQVVLVLLLGCVVGDVKVDDNGMATVEVKSKVGMAILELLKWICLLALYAGIVLVVASMVLIEPSSAMCPAGGQRL